MNKITAIVILVILAIVLFFLLKSFMPVFSRAIKNMPKGIFILLILVIIVVMIYLTSYIVNDRTGGNPGNNGESNDEIIEASMDDSQADVITESIENCIILRNDEIWIDNQKVEWDAMEKYIDVHVENNIEISIIDDYSTAVLHHKITDLCDEKGVKYKTEDETWIEQ